MASDQRPMPDPQTLAAMADDELHARAERYMDQPERPAIRERYTQADHIQAFQEWLVTSKAEKLFKISWCHCLMDRTGCGGHIPWKTHGGLVADLWPPVLRQDGTEV